MLLGRGIVFNMSMIAMSDMAIFTNLYMCSIGLLCSLLVSVFECHYPIQIWTVISCFGNFNFCLMFDHFPCLVEGKKNSVSAFDVP